MNPDISEPEEAPPAANAVSLFGQSGGVNDFPVLKAFQEYIDAEQAKARKRMLGLSVFFIVLLIVVVITFTLVITTVISRNQSLSDRLLDIALREKASAQPVVNVQSPAPAVVQPPAESAELIRLREELRREKEERKSDQAKREEERFNKLLEAIPKPQQQPVAAPTPVVVTTTPSPVLQPAAATESAELIRLREELRREKEERKAEQAKREEEKKKAEKEAFLRSQYPDYYAREDARRAAAAAPQAQVQKLRTMKPVSYFDSSAPKEDPELRELLKKRPQPQAKPPSRPAPAVSSNPKPPPAVAQPAAKPAPKPSAKPAPKPVVRPAATPTVQNAAQPEKKTETLAIGGAADGSSIPWLIELPNKK